MLIPILTSALVFVVIVYLGFLVQQRREAQAKRRSLAMVSGYASNNVSEAIAEAEAQNASLLAAGVTGLGRRLVGPGARQRLQRQALRAGSTSATIVEKTVRRKLAFGAAGIALGVLLVVGGGPLWWLSVPVFALAGFYVPDLLLHNRALHRAEEIGRLLPDALDLLTLCVESGLSFQAALNQVATMQAGPVADEFAIALNEMQLGRSRSQAMAAMAARTQQRDVEPFVSAILQVDRLGVPVSTVLREQAKEMRAKRYDRARELAQKVPVKILMPLMLCFLPALFVIILGPAAYQIAQVFSGQ